MALFQNRYVRERNAKLGKQFNPLGQAWLLILIWLIYAYFMSKIACWLTSGLTGLYHWIYSPASVAFLDGHLVNFDQLRQSWSFINIGNYSFVWTSPIVWWISEGVLSLVIAPLFIRIWLKHRNGQVHQYGANRFASLDEAIKQYPLIPDRKLTFDGYGGDPVAHIHAWNPELLKHQPIVTLKNIFKGVFGYYAIDQTTNNSLVVGITRSGKGETYVMPKLDILTRAKKRSSIVVTDPKKELYQSSYVKLRQRGYNVQVLDLQNPDVSMSYNPLARAVSLAQAGYYDQVQQEVNTFSSAIYVDPAAKDKFWQNSSINLLNALILALIDYAKRNNDWSKVTMYNAVHMMTDLGGSDANVNADDDIVWSEADAQLRGETVDYGDPDNKVTDQKNRLSLYFEHLSRLNDKVYSPFRSMAIEAFAQSKFAGEETSGNIYSSAMEGIKIYQQSDIAKLTSKNSLNFEQMGFPRILKMRFKQFANYKQLLTAKIIFKSMDGKVITSGLQQLDQLGYLTYAVKPTMPEKFKVIISFNFHRNFEEVLDQKVVFVGQKQYVHKNNQPVLDEYTKKPVFKQISLKVVNAKLSQHPEKVRFEYTEKPVALFLVTPPNNPAYNQIASFAIDQAFNQIYSLALQNGRKSFRRIQFLLDEFGNLPAIQKMDTKVSIGLGQNILFSIVVQNLEQLNSVYGKSGETIQSNCANLLYILTKSNKTAKEISEQLGQRTVKVTTHSGKVGSIHGNSASQQYMSQDLLTVPELEQLMGGEMVVLRSVYRQDKAGKSIAALPLFDTASTKMPFAHQLLKGTFSTTTSTAEIGLDSDHRRMNLKDSLINFTKSGGGFDQLGTVHDLANPEFLHFLHLNDSEEKTTIPNKLKQLAAQGSEKKSVESVLSKLEQPAGRPIKNDNLTAQQPLQLNNYLNPDRSDLIESNEDLPKNFVMDLAMLSDTNLCRACTDIVIDQLKKAVPPSKEIAVVSQIGFDDPHLWWQHRRHNSWDALHKIFMDLHTPQGGAMFKACQRKIKAQISAAATNYSF